MHWFWRVVIAMALAIVFKMGTSIVMATRLTPSQMSRLPLQLTLMFVGTLVPIAVYGLLTRWLARRPRDRETRCRQCDYILRGLTEPRCPECGEQI